MKSREKELSQKLLVRTLKSIWVSLGQVVGREISIVEVLFVEDVPEEWDVVCDPPDDVVVQGVDSGLDGVVTGSGVGRQFADHRVVVHGDLGTLLDARVTTNAYLNERKYVPS